MIPNFKGKPDITIQVIDSIPTELKSENNVLFVAGNDSQKFYSISKYEDYYKFIVYNQLSGNMIQQVALLSKDMLQWTVYTNTTGENGEIYPLQYPLGPIILYYLTVKFDAIMLHASGIDDNSEGRIFSGFSGVGKSTMAAIWQFKGSTIINDDRLIIRKENNEYFIYNTPMFYQDKPKKTKLKAIHLIHHSPENTVKKISGVLAISKVMAFCIQNNYNANFIEHHLEFLSGLCSIIPVYDIGFKPDPNIVDFIKLHAV